MKLRSKIINGILAVLAVLIGSVAIAIGYTEDCEPVVATASGNTMKAVIYRCYGGPEVLEYVDVAKPVPLDDEVRVEVHAAGVNPLDWHYMRGKPYIMRLMGAGIGSPADMRLGVDYAGVVEALDAGRLDLAWEGGGTSDTRVHPAQSLQFYRALKLIGKTPVRYVRYPGEGHGNAKAAARDDYTRRLLRWMEHFVAQGKTELPPWELEIPALADDESNDEE